MINLAYVYSAYILFQIKYFEISIYQRIMEKIYIYIYIFHKKY